LVETTEGELKVIYWTVMRSPVEKRTRDTSRVAA